MRGVGGGAGGSKNVKVISDQFSSHFGQFGTNLIFFVKIFFIPNLGGGMGQNIGN